MRRPSRKHSLRRTSPKGREFIGTCVLCGRQGLTLKDMNEECENVRGLSEGEALREALNERAGN